VSALQYVPLSETYRPPSEGSMLIGDVPSSEQLMITAYLRRRIPLPDPGSQAQRISRENFAARYGMDERDLHAVVQFANAYGLTICDVDRSSRRITLSGTAQQFSHAFRVDLVRYRDAAGKTYQTTTGPIHVPANLKDVFVSLLGFDTREQAFPRG
jgi:hypothetical protein